MYRDWFPNYNRLIILHPYKYLSIKIAKGKIFPIVSYQILIKALSKCILNKLPTDIYYYISDKTEKNSNYFFGAVTYNFITFSAQCFSSVIKTVIGLSSSIKQLQFIQHDIDSLNHFSLN